MLNSESFIEKYYLFFLDFFFNFLSIYFSVLKCGADIFVSLMYWLKLNIFIFASIFSSCKHLQIRIELLPSESRFPSLIKVVVFLMCLILLFLDACIISTSIFIFLSLHSLNVFLIWLSWIGYGIWTNIPQIFLSVLSLIHGKKDGDNHRRPHLDLTYISWPSS